MPNIVRTLAQLLGLFHDNNVGDISAQDGRDLCATVFGFPSTTDPTPDWDRSDSAGVGAFFDTGSKVTNTTTQVTWFCYDGTPHLAVWQPAWNGVPPTPPPSPTVVTGTSPIHVDYNGVDTYDVKAERPFMLMASADNVEPLQLRQYSGSQTADLLAVEQSSGTQFGTRITAAGELSNPGGPTSSGSDNEIVGHGAGALLTTASGNTLIGKDAGHNNTINDHNTAVGSYVLQLLFSGPDNTGCGYRALQIHQVGLGNSAFGKYALLNQNTGNKNTAIGCEAGGSVNGADENTFVGYQAGYLANCGAFNALFGSRAGYTHGGSKCTFLGALTDSTGGTHTQSTAVGYGATITADNQIVLGTATETVTFPGHTSGVLFSELTPPSITDGLWFGRPSGLGAGDAGFYALTVADLPSGYPYSSLSGAPAGGTSYELFDLDFSQFGSGPATITLRTMQPDETVERILAWVTDEWLFPITTTEDLQFGFSGGYGGIPANNSAYNYYEIVYSGTPTPFEGLMVLIYDGPSNRNVTAPWQLTVTLSGTSSIPTAGHAKVAVLVGKVS